MKRFLLVLLVISAGFVKAQERVLTLEEAVATALKSNYDIQLIKNDSTVFALDYKYRNAAFLPRFNATATKLWNSNNQRQDFADGTKREANDIRSSNTQMGVNMNWTLFDGLRMFATLQKLEEFTKLGELSVKDQIVTSVTSVVINYYNIVQLKQQIIATDEQISISEERVKLADRKLSVGLGSKPELLQARVDLNAQRAAQLRRLTEIEQLREQLNQLMGIETQTQYQVSDTIPIDLNLNYGEFATNLDQTNPSLLLAKKNIDIANLTLKERKAERWPVVSLNSAYNFNRNDNKAAINPFTPLFNQNQGFNIGFGATIPILNGFNARRLVQQAQIDIRRQELVLENQRSIVDVGLNNSFKNYEYQKKALILEEENIELAKENVNIALARFRQGVATYLELREAQISLAESYNRLIATRYNTKLSEIELKRLRGDIIR